MYTYPLSAYQNASITDFSLPENSELRKKIFDFDRVYTINLFNANAFDSTVTLFGAKEFLYGGLTGIPAGVTIDVPESSYTELMQETAYRPFIVGGMNFQASNTPQLRQIPNVLYRSPAGTRIQIPFHMSSSISIYQFQSNFIELYPLKLVVTSDRQFIFNLLALTAVSITLFITERVNMTNELFNEPVVEAGSDAEKFFISKLTVKA